MKKILEVSANRLEVPVETLIEYDKNNKIHGEKQIDAIANSINRFSYYDEIVIDKNNVIIAGHGRLEAIKKLGYDGVEVKQLDIDSNEAGAMRILDNLLNKFETVDNLENIVFDLDNGIDLTLGELELFDFLPELDAPKYNPEDYLDELNNPIETPKKELSNEIINKAKEQIGEENFYSNDEKKLNEKIDTDNGEVKVTFILPNPNHIEEIEKILKDNFNVENCLIIK